MLGGIAPILLFYFPLTKENLDLFPGLISPPTFEEGEFPGVPFPIYLDERLTGLFLQSESRNIVLDTQVQTTSKPTEKTFISQKGVSNTVSINLVGRRDSIALASLLAFCDIIFSKISSQSYRVSYLNGPTVIFWGRLEGLNTSVRENTDLLDISFQISRGEKTDTKTDPSLITVPQASQTSASLSNGVGG